MPRILVTGFGPFRHHLCNPSGDIAKIFDGFNLGEYAIDGIVLDVDEQGPQKALQAIAHYDYAAIIMFGLSARNTLVTFELQAHNISAAGDGPVISGGPSEIPTNFPVHNQAFAEFCRAHESYFKSSCDAGTFWCNETYYRALYATRSPTLFVHIPPNVDLCFVAGLLKNIPKFIL